MKKKKVKRCWKRASLYTYQFVLLFAVAANTQQHNKGYGWIEFGYSPMVYNSVFSIEFQNAIDIEYSYQLYSNVYIKTGLRLSTSPIKPEGFVRLTLRAFERVWHPEIGLELGCSGRVEFADGRKLLRETRKAMEQRISPLYFAIQSSPVAFRIFRDWELSLLELHIGTHLDHPGRTLRMQLGIISIGRHL